MIGLDLWAAAAASVASAAIGMRARMLRPHERTWTPAPMAVWGGLSVLALALGMSAVSIWFGAHASAREALVYSVLALVGLAMLWNLNRNGRDAAARRRQIRDDVATAMEASGSPARYPFEPRR